MTLSSVEKPSTDDQFQAVLAAQKRLSAYLTPTPVTQLPRLNAEFDQNLYIKREDFQPVRSFKVRGALNKLLKLTQKQKESGVVCASAGNHAQGLAYACWLLNVHCVVFLPKNTPKQKVNQVSFFGKAQVKLVLAGDNFDQACQEAHEFCLQNDRTFIHPFDDYDVIAGQGTLALELHQQVPEHLDYLFVPVGGGGLLAGIVSVFSQLRPETEVVGVELEGAAAMALSLAQGAVTALSEIDTFADGTAVKQVGQRGFEMARGGIQKIAVLKNVDVCRTLLDLHNEHGIITEPSGALAIAAAQKLSFKGKHIACVLSGSNNDASRYHEYLTYLKA